MQSDAIQNGITVQTIVLGSFDLGAMDFSDLKPIEIPVTAPGGDRYVLREASAGASTSYDNAKMRAAKMADGKLAGFDGMFDAELVLLSECLHPIDKGTGHVKVDPNGNPWPTPISRIKSWPDRFFKPLLDRLKKISPDLAKEDTVDSLDDQIKNLQTKRDELVKKQEKADGKLTSTAEEDAKNAPSATTATSA